MKVTFYKHGCNNSGYFVQMRTPERSEFMTKSEMLKIVDCTKDRFDNVFSTDINNVPKKEIWLLAKSNHYLKIEPFVKAPKVIKHNFA